MSNIIKFPNRQTRNNLKALLRELQGGNEEPFYGYIQDDPVTRDLKKYLERAHRTIDKLTKELNKTKRLSLWDRIFNWPY